MMVSVMSDDWLRRVIVGAAQELADTLNEGVGDYVECSFAICVDRAVLDWLPGTPAAMIEADAAMIATVADRYSDPETKTGRMWNDISLLAREIGKRAKKARNAPK